MLYFQPRLRPFLYLLLTGFAILQACATNGQHEAGEKIGMHIDAVLQFAIEYPLAWSKDRRVTYGTRQGEIRWKEPSRPGALLMVRSTLVKQPAATPAQQIDQLSHEYGGLEISAEDQVELPAGEAWKVSGHTAQDDLQFYLLTHEQRSYLISLRTARGTIDNYRDIMSRVTSSFQAIP